MPLFDEKRISLFEKRASHSSIFISVGLNKDGDLVLDGQELGSFIEDMYGDSDLEYFVTVKKKDVPRLQACLDASDKTLLEAMRRFADRDAEIKFRKFLDKHAIPYKTFRYI